MVTTEFQNRAPEGYAEAQEIAQETGNAFGVGQYGRETINALQNALMNGDDDSSIGSASMKLSGHFKNASADKKDKKENGLSMAEMALLQQTNAFLSVLEGRIEEIESDLADLRSAYERHESGEFDPLNNEQDRAILEHFNITAEEFSELSIQAQNELFVQAIESMEVSLRQNRELYRHVESNPEALVADSEGNFTDPAMALIQQESADMGRPVDGNNMDFDDRTNLVTATMRVDRQIIVDQIDLGESSNNVHLTSQAQMDGLW